jgi:predicted RNase H-like nuclease (RuvC/YqgF family)
METKGLEVKLEGIKVSIVKTGKDIDAVRTRKEEALNKQQRLQGQYEAAREERQGLLASGKDAKKVNEIIRTFRADMELLEDEVIGLDKILQELEASLPRLIKEEEETGRDILKSKLLPLIPEYNEAAARLAMIVEKIWELRRELNEPYTGATVVCVRGFNENALSEIPRLFSPNEDLPVHNTLAAVFFSWQYWHEEKQRELLAARQTRKAARELSQGTSVEATK